MGINRPLIGKINAGQKYNIGADTLDEIVATDKKDVIVVMIKNKVCQGH